MLLRALDLINLVVSTGSLNGSPSNEVDGTFSLEAWSTATCQEAEARSIVENHIELLKISLAWERVKDPSLLLPLG